MAGDRRRRLTARRPSLQSSWLLGLLVSILSWNVVFSPPSFGLDPSWWSAMYMAAERGMQFGSQVIFTYGPLAFLREPWLWYGNLAVLGFLYSAALHIALSITVLWALRRTLTTPIAVLLALAVMLATPARDVSLALAACWCLVALSAEPPRATGWLVAVGGGALGACESLVELRSGPVIWGICLIALLGRREWRVLVPAFVASAAVAFAALWFAAGQSSANLGDFISSATQIVAGYGEAMGLQGSGTLSRLAIAGVVLLGLAAVALAARTTDPGRERVAAALLAGLVAFALYKEAVVRAEPHHETIFFSTIAVVSVAFAYGVHRRAGALTVLALSVLALLVAPSDAPLDLNPASHVSTAYDQAKLLLDPGRRARIEFFYAIAMVEHYQIDPATLSLVKGYTVDVDPWEAAVAWAYGLRWDPVPVFQNYSAYTSDLDHRDAAALSSAAGPQRILRENTALIDHTPPSIDGRLRAWDPPATTLAMLCNYVPLRTTQRWQVLGKVPDRCGRPRLLQTIDARYGQAVSIPSPPAGGILYAVVDGAAVHGVFERLRTLLYRAKFRYAVINGSGSYRVVPGTSADGLLLDASPTVDYPAPFDLSLGVRTLEFTGPSGSLRLKLEWMPVRTAR